MTEKERARLIALRDKVQCEADIQAKGCGSTLANPVFAARIEQIAYLNALLRQ